MRLLLDTHVFLWAAGPEARLSQRAGALIADSGNMVHVSIATLWEIAIKVSARKLRFDPSRFATMVQSLNFQVLSIDVPHCVEAANLPLHHRDPFDRMMVAQARVEGLTLVTADRTLARYDVPLLSATD